MFYMCDFELAESTWTYARIQTYASLSLSIFSVRAAYSNGHHHPENEKKPVIFKEVFGSSLSHCQVDVGAVGGAILL